MARGIFLLSVVGFCVWVYTLIDCIRTDESRTRGLPKAMWVFVVILLPLVGSVLWFAIGKERAGAAGSRPMTRQTPPDDDVAFLDRLGAEYDREERIRRLEEKLAALDEEDSDGGSGGGPDGKGLDGKTPGAPKPDTNHPGDDRGDEPAR